MLHHVPGCASDLDGPWRESRQFQRPAVECAQLSGGRLRAVDASSEPSRAAPGVTREGYGRAFGPRRRDHRYCLAACRSRGLARRRADQLRAALAGLDVARAALVEELVRWAAAAEAERGGG